MHIGARDGPHRYRESDHRLTGELPDPGTRQPPTPWATVRGVRRFCVLPPAPARTCLSLTARPESRDSHDRRTLSEIWPVDAVWRSFSSSRPSGQDDDLRARADMRSKLVPAAHGLELRGGGGARAVDLVDRRIYALRDLFRLAARGLRYLARGHIAAAAPHP